MATISDGDIVLEIQTINPLTVKYELKNTIHQLINTTKNIYENTGGEGGNINDIAKNFNITFRTGYKKVSNSFALSSIQDINVNNTHDTLMQLLTSGKELLFVPDQTGVQMYVNVLGSPEVTYSNVYGSTIEVTFTTARKAYATDFALPAIKSNNVVKKPNFFDKLKKAFKKAADYRDKARDAIAVATGFCNNIASNIDIVSQQLNITSSMINSAFDGLSVLADARQNFTNQLTFLVSSIKNIPNNFNNHLEKLLDSVKSISTIFQTNSPDESEYLNINYLLDTAETISNVPTEDTYKTTKYDIYGNEYTAYTTTNGNSINAIQARKNILFIQLLFYIAILFEIYEKIQNINSINKLNLDKMHAKIMSLYKKIINHEYIDEDLLNMVNEAHVVYQENFAELQKLATNYIDYYIAEPTPLSIIVSNINNGNNLDFFEETVAINKLTDIFAVQGKIRILYNE